MEGWRRASGLGDYRRGDGETLIGSFGEDEPASRYAGGDAVAYRDTRRSCGRAQTEACTFRGPTLRRASRGLRCTGAHLDDPTATGKSG